MEEDLDEEIGERYQRYNTNNKSPIQDQPKWWRAGEDLKGTKKMKEDPIQDQPKWWRVGRI